MSWVNLNDVYVNKTGDTIAGNLSVNGALTVNDGKGTNTTYNVANEITTLRGSVSHGDTIVLYGAPDKASYIYIQRVGSICILRWSILQESAIYWQPDATIPDELRPDVTMYMPSCVTNNNGYVLNVCGYCYINKNGILGFQVAAATAGAFNRGACSWIIK